MKPTPATWFSDLIVLLSQELTEKESPSAFIHHLFNFLGREFCIESMTFYLHLGAEPQQLFYLFKDSSLFQLKQYLPDAFYSQIDTKLIENQPFYVHTTDAGEELVVCIYTKQQLLGKAHFTGEKWSQHPQTRLLADTAQLVIQHLRLFFTSQVISHKKIREEKSNMLRQVISQAPLALFSIDRQGVFQLAEGLGVLRTGMKSHEIIGKSLFDVFKEHDLIINDVKKALSGEFVYSVLSMGDYVYENKLLPMFDEQGQVSGVMGISTDISRRARVESALKKQTALLSEILDAIPINIFLKDEKGRFMFINKHTAQTIGIKREDFIGKTVHDIFPTYLAHKISQDDIKVRSSGDFSIKETSLNWAGAKRALLEGKTLINLAGSRENWLLGYSIDISEQKRIQQELTEARQQAERAKAAEDLFLANMSHEIRTPINGIIGFINLLLNTPLTAQQKNYLTSIKTSADNLKVIINDILDFTKIHSGKLSFEQAGFLVVEQVQAAVFSFELQAKEKRIELDCRMDEQLQDMIVIGDCVRLKQILINLLSNAIKFTQQGRVQVSVSRLQDEDWNSETAKLLFEISDTGIGIPEEKLGNIFEHFTQADESITRKFGGTGLGLSICKQLVELQGGQITVQSRVNCGTTFLFWINYRVGQESDLPGSEQRKIGLSTIRRLMKGKRILLVEDNIINQRLATNLLNQWNTTVEVAENGLLAIENLKKHNYDLVLMDVQMPVMDGFEATRYIRQHIDKPKNQIPIIAVTANAINGYAEKCLEVGMDDYISKPFSQEHLLMKLINIFKLSRALENSEEEMVEDTAAETVPASSTTSMAHPQLIDLTYLKQFSNDDRDFIMDMIETFVDACKKDLPAVLQAAAADEWPQVKFLVHKLKPSITFMGIHQIRQEVALCESLAEKKEDPEQIRELVKLISETCRKAVNELEAMLREENWM